LRDPANPHLPSGVREQAIRDVENTMMGMGLQCSPDKLDSQAISALNSGQAFKQNGKIEDVAKLQMDLGTLAFACNATRIATLQCGDGTDVRWLGHRSRSRSNAG
jgi:hypothetical protein